MVKSIRYVTTAFIILFLSSCVETQDKIRENLQEFQLYESPVGYQISAPRGFSYSELVPSKEYYYFGYPSNSSTGLRTIEIYDQNIECNPETSGVSAMQKWNLEEDLKWGPVDIRQSHPFKPFPNALCVIPQPENCTKQDYFQGGCESDAAAYVLCAEKNDKKVLICVTQITDSPDLAKQIFETFRWSE